MMISKGHNNVREISIENDLVWNFCFCNYLFIFKLIVNEIGNERQNQDLGEDENRASNDNDTQRSNNSEENNNQANNDDNANNTRGIFITWFK